MRRPVFIRLTTFTILVDSKVFNFFADAVSPLRVGRMVQWSEAPLTGRKDAGSVSAEDDPSPNQGPSAGRGIGMLQSFPDWQHPGVKHATADWIIAPYNDCFALLLTSNKSRYT